MKRDFINGSRTLSHIAAVLFCVATVACAQGEPPAAAVSAFHSYVGGVEARLAVQHRSADGFLALPDGDSPKYAQLRRGELAIEEMTPAGGVGLPGALLHHWRGTAFVEGAKAGDLERILRDFDSYPRRFSPQVLRAQVVMRQGDRVQVSIRVVQQHIITVVMDTGYDVSFGRLDARHGYSASRSKRISEIASPGTTSEHPLGASEEHGFLWRQNTYWNYEERDGGLYMQIESVSLSRSIPVGLGWAVRPFVESVPRDSLEFTLRSMSNALRN
ncbi:MAG: hypothetical protein M3O31_17225 [Acidobacteriota bacterium]|nr:hypothetical protein [Acidobacteriota bacterium]